jgi:hypothetical protein
MADLVTTAQFGGIVPDIQAAIQQGQRTRAITQEETNRQRLAELEQQQLATRQRALGVPSEIPDDETQMAAQMRAIADDPVLADKFFRTAGIDTEAKREEAAAFAFNVRNAPEEQKNELISNRVREIAARGGDPKDTMELLDMTPAMRNTVLEGVEAAALTARERQAGEISTQRARTGASAKAFAPVTLVNPETGQKVPHIPTFDPATGKARLEKADLPEGFELSKETATEKRQAEVAVTEAKKAAEITGKGIAQRRQVAIDKGLDASEGFANLVRARDLLETLDTGGIDAVSLRAKQVFGVEGANEAELSNRLGKAVLSQLRATFGAAFTEREGARLQNIEAGFGKSTEGNKRLISQTMKIVNRAAKRGIKAAEAAGDMEAAQDIKDALAFRLDVLPQGVSEADITETMRANNMTRQQVLDRLRSM